MNEAIPTDGIYTVASKPYTQHPIYYTGTDTAPHTSTYYPYKQTDALEEYKNMDIDHLNQHDKMNYEKALNDLLYAKDTMDELLGRVPVDDDTQATQKGKKIKFKFKRK